MLDQLFARLSRDAFGDHALRRTGSTGERTETSSPWQFGRPFELDLRGTLAGALGRAENAPAVSAARVAAGGRRILLSPGDFVVHDSEDRSDAATVLLLDMSRSMLLRGCALAAKKVALALQALIRSQFPRDTLHIVSFAYSARENPGRVAGDGQLGRLRVRHQPAARADGRAAAAGQVALRQSLGAGHHRR